MLFLYTLTAFVIIWTIFCGFATVMMYGAAMHYEGAKDVQKAHSYWKSFLSYLGISIVNVFSSVTLIVTIISLK